MDNLTHSLVALTLARTPLGRVGRGATAALVVASNVPDIDAVSLFLGGRLSYLQWHRGPTHGLLGAPVLGLAVACLVWIGRRLAERRRERVLGPAADTPDAAPFGHLVAVSVVGVALHVIMDLMTPYGTRLLSPFAWPWFAADWLPIIDIYLLVVLVIGLIVGTASPGSRRRVAAAAIVLMTINYGARATAHHQALALAPQLFGAMLPQRCAPPEPMSPIDVWPRAGTPVTSAAAPCLVELAAMPTFVSPFRWRLIARLSNAYEMHDVDLLDRRHRDSGDRSLFWRAAVRIPDVWTPAVMEAAATHVGRTFLGFSRFPAARSSVGTNGETTVRWTDVRFAGGVFDLTAPRRPDPFIALVRLAPDGRVLQQQVGP